MERIAPWTEIGQATVLAEKFGKKLVTQKFRDPGTESEHEFVLFGQKDWSVVLPLTEDRRVVAIEQYKQGCDRIVLELPAGTLDSVEEPPVNVARRELLEETGYQTNCVIPLEPSQFMSTRSSWTRFYMFLALGCRKVGEPTPDPTEALITRLIPLPEWLDLCHREIVEPSAIVTTFRSLPHLGYETRTVAL